VTLTVNDLAMLPCVTRRAHRLLDRRHDNTARRLLAQALAGIDPDTAPADPRIIAAAVAYLAALTFLPDVPGRRDIRFAWARYAYTASMHRYGTGSGRWQHAATVYACVLADQGFTFDAAMIYQRKLQAFAEHGLAREIPTARKQFAVALHVDGQCDQALHQVRTALDECLRLPCAETTTSEIVISYAGILHACGHTGAAETVLAQDTELTGSPDGGYPAAAWVAAARISMIKQAHLPMCSVRPAQARATP
jgi:hypothetical protein